MKKQVYNPYLPDFEYLPDGEPYVFGERLYIYGSHDKFGGNKYCENDYVSWSAPVNDLSDWKYEGVIYKNPSSTSELYAPDVALGSDGRYYLYYSIAGSSVISVAVCDTPAGQYQYYGDVHDNSGRIVGLNKGDYQQFDPSVFVDCDGRVFLYSGFGPGRDEDELGRKFVGCHVSELERDMITIKNGPNLLIPKEWRKDKLQGYFEAPSMRKINGIYYLVYSARCTGLYYYYSEYPDKDFKFGGRIHSTSDFGFHNHNDEKNPAFPIGNTHGGIVEINGQYYIFDHRHTNNNSYCRQGVAEKIIFDENGHISQVEATSCGLNGDALVAYGKYPASICCNLMFNNGVKGATYITQDIEDVTDPQIAERLLSNDTVQYIKDLENNALIGFKYFYFDRNISHMSLELRGTFSGNIRLYFVSKDLLWCTDNKNKNEFEILITADYLFEQNIQVSNNDWVEKIININMLQGRRDLALYITVEGTGTVDFRSFEFRA